MCPNDCAELGLPVLPCMVNVPPVLNKSPLPEPVGYILKFLNSKASGLGAAPFVVSVTVIAEAVHDIELAVILPFPDAKVNVGPATTENVGPADKSKAKPEGRERTIVLFV